MRTVATAGHVDHGKSTLVRALTGMEPDRWAEERERGLTIDLGFVWTDLPGPRGDALTVAFVDVPGHERFVGNMLAGAGAVRLALLVVAADDGWQAQSQEHLEILDLLDVPAAVVAVTKADVAGDERALTVAADVEARLGATGLSDAPIVITDAVAGRGLDELADTLARRLQALPPAPVRDRARLWIDRSFVISGAGTVVTGTLAEGRLTGGDEVGLLPDGRRVRVRGLQSLGAPVESAGPGDRVAVDLSGVDRDEIGRGDAVVRPAGAWVPTDELEAEITALPGHELGRRGAWQLHVGSASGPVGILPLLNSPVGGPSGGRGFARLRLAGPLALHAGDRFVIRDVGRNRTAGGGRVLDPRPGAPARGADRRLARAERLEAVAGALGDRGAVLAALVAAAGGARAATEARAAAGTAGDGGLEAIGDWLADPEQVATWSGAVTERLADHHDGTDDAPGLDRTALAAAAAAAGCPDGLADALPDHLTATGRLRRFGASYALAEHAGRVEAARRQRRRALLDRLDADPLAPPRLAEVADELGVSAGEIQRLEQDGEVVRCGELAFTAAAVDDAVERLRALPDGGFTAAEAKRAWGTTRRYAIPLLEHLAARGVTRFDGERHHLIT